MLKVQDLAARDSQESFEQLSLKLESGQVLAVLGAENCGKHLLAQVLAGQVLPRTGEVMINNYRRRAHPERARAQTGYCASPPTLELFLTGFEWLDLIGSMYRLPPKVRAERIPELAEQLNIGPKLFSVLENAPVGTRQKVALAAAVIHRPALLVLDQPSQSLAFNDHHRIVKTIQQTASDGAVVVLVSDDVELVAQVADRYLVLDHGAKRLEGTLKELVNQTRSRAHSLRGVLEAIYGDV